MVKDGNVQTIEMLELVMHLNNEEFWEEQK